MGAAERGRPLFARKTNCCAVSDNVAYTVLDLRIRRIFRQRYFARLIPRAEIVAQHVVLNCHRSSFGTTTALLLIGSNSHPFLRPTAEAQFAVVDPLY
jgi:hypothetical protein